MPPLFVDTLVRCDADTLWQLTQDPAQHSRWDLRFSAIHPAIHPEVHPDGAPGADGRQRFTYVLSLPHPRLPLVTVTGTGVSVGERRGADGRGTSALRFSPHGRLSPLGEGSGYWRYEPTARGFRFSTGYDYAPGWGPLGRLLDPVLVRPAVGWATAWSFDRLRLWAQEGVDPARARDRALADVAARALLVALAAPALRTRRPAGAAVAALAVAAAVLVPVGRGTPSARRCGRRPARPERPAGTP
ncbi:hypothetical protein [Kineococcus sp. SYSU DK004]|uniref:hypothetical protein n=1 Tax=Kineococcus sp. SYSU DK004 TaxID=3383125 RepID=UPI003D7D91F6